VTFAHNVYPSERQTSCFRPVVTLFTTPSVIAIMRRGDDGVTMALIIGLMKVSSETLLQELILHYRSRFLMNYDAKLPIDSIGHRQPTSATFLQNVILCQMGETIAPATEVASYVNRSSNNSVRSLFIASNRNLSKKKSTQEMTDG
jgi:hypothetical protein